MTSKRELVSRGDELARRHGTRRGLELTLKIAFPEHPLRVEDAGNGDVAGQEASAKKADAAAAGFVVYCDAPLDEHELGAVSRLIEQVKPVNVTYKLRVKAARSTGGVVRGRARACLKCGHENPDDVDFCEQCGEYVAGSCRECARPSRRRLLRLRRRRPPRSADDLLSAPPGRRSAARRHGPPPVEPAPAPPPEVAPPAAADGGAYEPAAGSSGEYAEPEPEPEPDSVADHAAPPGGRQRDRRRGDGAGRGGRGHPHRRADPQPERHRRQLRPAGRGAPGRVVVDRALDRLPRPVRRARRRVRAGGRGHVHPAAGARRPRRARGRSGSSPSRRRTGRARARPPPAARHHAVPRARGGDAARAHRVRASGPSSRSRCATARTRPSTCSSPGIDPDNAMRFSFQKPRFTVEPGRRNGSAIMVTPPKPAWFGRPVAAPLRDHLDGDRLRDGRAAEVGVPDRRSRGFRSGCCSCSRCS